MSNAEGEGAPMGCESHERMVIRDRVEKITDRDRLPLIKGPQSRVCHSHSSLAQSNVMFSWRTIKPLPHQDL